MSAISSSKSRRHGPQPAQQVDALRQWDHPWQTWGIWAQKVGTLRETWGYKWWYLYSGCLERRCRRRPGWEAAGKRIHRGLGHKVTVHKLMSVFVQVIWLRSHENRGYYMRVECREPKPLRAVESMYVAVSQEAFPTMLTPRTNPLIEVANDGNTRSARVIFLSSRTVFS